MWRHAVPAIADAPIAPGGERDELVVRHRRSGADVAVMIVAVLSLAACAATPAWEPNSPRNGAGQFVDPRLGTPLPGQTMGYDSM